MADIFISYKKEDRVHAERVAACFAEEQLSVWWDNDILPREAWDKTIEKEIAACSAVVVLWSPRAVLSDWVRTEAHYGHDRGKLAPAMIERCEKPIAFMLTQTVDLTSWDGDRTSPQWRKLLAWVADLCTAKSEAAGTPTPVSPNRYRAAIGTLASGEMVVDGAFINLATPAGTVFRDQAEAPAMRIITRGDFTIGASPGDPDAANVEGPPKRIELDKPFALGVYPVLRTEYERVMGPAPRLAAPAAPAARGGWFGRGRAAPAAASVAVDPAAAVSGVSFDDCVKFAAQLAAATGRAYRLPSEAEWEYACRAGSRTRYAFGDTLSPTQAVCRFKGAPVPTGPAAPGAFAANRFGLYDMHGNVREWTADIWHESYDFTPADGSPALDGHASMRVVRGGGWADTPLELRSSARGRATQSIRSDVIGFRLALSLD